MPEIAQIKKIYTPDKIWNRIDAMYPPEWGSSGILRHQVEKLVLASTEIKPELAALLSEGPVLGIPHRAFVLPDRRGIFYLILSDRENDFSHVLLRLWQMSPRQAKNARIVLPIVGDGGKALIKQLQTEAYLIKGVSNR